MSLLARCTSNVARDACEIVNVFFTLAVDGSSGFGDGKRGPCVRGDPAYAAEFQAAGLVPDHGEYYFPRTMAWFLFGDEDTSSSVPQGLLYHDELVRTGNPLVRMDVVLNTPHSLPSTREGANAVRDVLLQECHVR